MKRNPGRPRLNVTADARSVVGHAGARLLSDLGVDALFALTFYTLTIVKMGPALFDRSL